MGNAWDEGADIDCQSFNPGARTVLIINQENQRRLEKCNALGEITDVYDDLCGHITYEYDAIGNLTLLTGADGVATEMKYDLAGRKYFMKDLDKGEWEYAYNALGELKRQLDSKQQAIDFEYDSLSRVTDRFELRDVEGLGDTDVTTVNHEITTWINDEMVNGLGQISSSVVCSSNSM